MRQGLIVAMCIGVGCVSSNSVVCGDGSLCPANNTCVSVAATDATMLTFCASPDQLATCTSLGDGMACQVQSLPGTCHSGACLPSACGNRVIDYGEACDDGNVDPHDGCSADCTSTEACGNSTIDLAEGEQCDTGDHSSNDGCSSTCLDETPHAQRVGIDASVAGAAYDVERRSIVVFGGANGAETLEWDGKRWHVPTTIDHPLPRSGTALAYDVARHEIVMFSGAPQASDTWTYNGTWAYRVPATSPSARFFASAVYDSMRHVVVLWSGSDRYLTLNNSAFDETWEWDGTTWTDRAITGPPPRIAAASAYDEKRGVMVVYGGTDLATFDFFADLWEYDGTAWTHKPFSGLAPDKRTGAMMAYDPINQRVMLVGGRDDPASVAAKNDVWEWDGSAWHSLGTVANPGVSGGALVTDPIRKVVVLICSDAAGNLEVQEWNGSSWAKAPAMTNESAMPNRMGAGIAYDSKRARLVVFGGSTYAPGDFGELQDTWTWDGVWHAVTSAAPSARSRPAMAYDPVRDAAILFGGEVSDGTATTPLAETWQWKNEQWTHLFPTTNPGPRREAGMAFDVAHGKLVMFGGVMHNISGLAVELDETWTWNGSDWHLETPAHKPSKRGSQALAYDPVRQRIVLFGGGVGAATFYDTWTWDGSDWTEIHNIGGPAPRMQAAFAWDAALERLVLVGGWTFTQGGVFVDEDVWDWDGSQWHFLAATSIGGRRQAMAASALDGGGILVYGGLDDLTFNARRDLWRVRWASRSATETCADVDADGDGLAGCADPDCWWRCSGCEPGATCGLAARCGDGACDAATETCVTCAVDCGACP